MIKDPLLQLADRLHYPWVSRIDRRIYQQHPELDPAALAKKCLAAGFVGYWAGRILERNRKATTVIAILPVIVHYLWSEWKLAQQLRAFDEVDFDAIRKLPSIRKEQNGQKKIEQTNSIKQKTTFKNIRKMPDLQSKILNPKDFISQLQSTYFC